jgi:hypothetical protein
MIEFEPSKIAQRFNAGFPSRSSPKSLQGREDRCGLLALLSSLKGLRYFRHIIFPALKRWAIFKEQMLNWYRPAARARDNLRIAS